MKENYKKELEFEFSHGDNDTDDVDESFKKAVAFVNSGCGLTLEEIKDSPHLQNVISSVMSKSWRGRNAQFNFIKMLAGLPEDVSLKILRKTHEMCLASGSAYSNDKDKSNWRNAVIKYMGRIDINKTSSDLEAFSSKIMEIFNTKINTPL